MEEAKPRVISCALGNPKDLVKKVHDEGLLFMHQVHTAKQAIGERTDYEEEIAYLKRKYLAF
jgi:NAD(P)H-dependent flavin oxidoreductase YrpB (nitropropane dioxygenase family)